MEIDCELQILCCNLITISDLTRLAVSDPKGENTTCNLQAPSADGPNHISNLGTLVSELDMIPASRFNLSAYQNLCVSGAQIIPVKSWAASELDFPGTDYYSSQTADDWTNSDISFSVEANIRVADSWRGFANYIDPQSMDNCPADTSYFSSQTVD